MTSINNFFTYGTLIHSTYPKVSIQKWVIYEIYPLNLLNDIETLSYFRHKLRSPQWWNTIHKCIQTIEKKRDTSTSLQTCPESILATRFLGGDVTEPNTTPSLRTSATFKDIMYEYRRILFLCMVPSLSINITLLTANQLNIIGVFVKLKVTATCIRWIPHR